MISPAITLASWADAYDKVYRMGEGFIVMIPNIVLGVLVFGATYLVGLGVRRLVQRASARRKKRHLALLLGRVVQGAVFVLAVLLAAVVIFPTFTPGRLLDFLGIGSVAIGFAFRDVLQNYLAGILLLITEPFRIGDQIVFGAHEGTVEDIQTRATFILTYDGRRVVIPNAELFTNSVIVNTAFPYRRIEYDIGIGYGDDVEKARAIMLQVLRESPEAIDDPAPDVLLWAYAESSVTLRARWWVKPPARRDVLDARDVVLTTLKQRLTAAGIDLPFPTQQMLFHDQTEETDGDRRRQREGWPAGESDAPKPRSIADGLRQLRRRPERPADDRHHDTRREDKPPAST